MSTKQVFTFKEGNYTLETLRLNLRNGPRICIKSEDLDPGFTTAVKLPADFDDSREPIALYQYSGKYFVLLGMKKITSLLASKNGCVPSVNISGYLVTKHMLKKAQVVDRVPEPVTQSVQNFPTAQQRDRRGERGDNNPYRRDYQPRAGQRHW